MRGRRPQLTQGMLMEETGHLKYLDGKQFYIVLLRYLSYRKRGAAVPPYSAFLSSWLWRRCFKTRVCVERGLWVRAI